METVRFFITLFSAGDRGTGDSQPLSFLDKARPAAAQEKPLSITRALLADSKKGPCPESAARAATLV
jgi:hypothetical protein